MCVEHIGARIKFRDALSGRSRRTSEGFSIDVISDRRGEYFDVLCMDKALKFDVLNVQPKDSLKPERVIESSPAHRCGEYR